MYRKDDVEVVKVPGGVEIRLRGDYSTPDAARRMVTSVELDSSAARFLLVELAKEIDA